MTEVQTESRTGDAGKFYITTPIYYVNDRPHIGHVYTTTIADILARYHRLRGDDTFFLTGTDEHAAKVVDAAAERGLTPLQWADRNAEEFQNTFARLGMSNDDFIRTTQPRHREKVAQYVQQLIDRGDVYEGRYEGWYDAGQEEYIPETKAREWDYKSPINGKPLVRRAETNYFFRLSAYADRLLKLLDSPPGDDAIFAVQPAARRNEVAARIREGLNDVPISRSSGDAAGGGGAGGGGWGIKVPGNDSHTIYVWIDALFNYLSTIDNDDRRHYWPADVHLIAKDILWFHAVIWPAMLMALDKPLPKLIYAHSFWIAEGQKMSKSLGNFIDLEKIDHYVQTFSLDALRYFLATQGPMGTTDSDFAETRFIETYNTDLANTLGNCISRVTNMIGRYFEGKLPECGDHFRAPTTPAMIDRVGHQDVMQRAAWGAVGASPDEYEQMRLQDAAEEAVELVRYVDAFIEDTAPFKLAKDPANLPQVGTILYQCAEALRIVSILLWPVMPHKMETFWRRIGCGHYADQLANHGRGDFEQWTKWGRLKPGTPIEKGEALFPRHLPER